jgi:hypothetical protein
VKALLRKLGESTRTAVIAYAQRLGSEMDDRAPQRIGRPG